MLLDGGRQECNLMDTAPKEFCVSTTPDGKKEGTKFGCEVAWLLFVLRTGTLVGEVVLVDATVMSDMAKFQRP